MMMKSKKAEVKKKMPKARKPENLEATQNALTG